MNFTQPPVLCTDFLTILEKRDGGENDVMDAEIPPIIPS
jgi:hypothetical protein